MARPRNIDNPRKLARDFWDDVHQLGKAHVTASHGRFCDEIPLCRKEATRLLVFKDGSRLDLCEDAYKRYLKSGTAVRCDGGMPEGAK